MKALLKNFPFFPSAAFDFESFSSLGKCKYSTRYLINDHITFCFFLLAQGAQHQTENGLGTLLRSRMQAESVTKEGFSKA